MHYSSLPAELVGLCVDDTPAEFFEKIDGIYGGLGLGGLRSETIMRLEQHIGLGYARSTAEELQYITEVSDRVMSDCHFAVPLNHFTPGFLSNSVAVFRK